MCTNENPCMMPALRWVHSDVCKKHCQLYKAEMTEQVNEKVRAIGLYGLETIKARRILAAAQSLHRAWRVERNGWDATLSVLKKAEAERDALRAEVASLRQTITVTATDEVQRKWREMEQGRDALRAEVERLRAALKEDADQFERDATIANRDDRRDEAERLFGLADASRAALAATKGGG